MNHPTIQELSAAVTHIKEMEDAIDEFLTDQFADLEIGLDDINVKEDARVFLIFDRVSDKAKEIDRDLKKLRKVLGKISKTAPDESVVLIPADDDPIFTEEDIKKVMEAIK